MDSFKVDIFIQPNNTLILTPPRHNPGIGKLSSSWKLSVMLCLRMMRICLLVADDVDDEAANILNDSLHRSRYKSTTGTANTTGTADSSIVNRKRKAST